MNENKTINKYENIHKTFPKAFIKLKFLKEASELVSRSSVGIEFQSVGALVAKAQSR